MAKSQKRYLVLLVFGLFSYYSSRSMDGIWKKNSDI